MAMAPAQLVDGPVRVPLPYGLFSVVTPLEPTDPHWQSGITWETQTCEGVGIIGDPTCDNGDDDGGETETLSFDWELYSLDSGTEPYISGHVRLVAVAGDPQSVIPAGDYITTWTDGPSDTTTRQTDSTSSTRVALNPGSLSTQEPVEVTATVTGPYGIEFSVTGTTVAWGDGETVLDSGTVTYERPVPVGVTQAVGLPKQFTGPGDDGEATPFTVYGRYKCSSLSKTPEQAQDYATAHLQTREEGGVESYLWDKMNTDAEWIDSDAAVLSPGEAIRRLERHIATTYGSLGVIHVPRGALSAMGPDYFIVKGNKITTLAGTPVIAGGGYDSRDIGTDELDITLMFATPALLVYRSEVFTSSNRAADLLDRSHNDMYAVAERTYTVGYDPCGVAGVKARMSCCLSLET